MGLGPYTRSWDEEFQYAEGSQLKNVEGDVLKWHHDRGLETIPAAEYITSLEQEVAWLRKQARLFCCCDCLNGWEMPLIHGLLGKFDIV